MPEIVGRLRTPRLAGAPSSPAVGEVYYDTALNVLYWWNGTAWISAAGTTQLDYNGAYPTGTPYTDGDIVVYNGISYLCVRPTSAAPKPWFGGPTPAVYGTSLPASPYDGQEAILVDSVTNPTYQWRFRYNAGSSSAYKWGFIGGNPWNSADVVDLAPGNAWGYNEPTFWPPRQGVYYVISDMVLVQNLTTVNNTPSHGPGIHSQGAPPAYTTVHAPVANGYVSMQSVPSRLTNAGAGAFCCFCHGGAGGAVFKQRRLSVLPVQVA